MSEPLDALVRELQASREQLLAVVAGVTEEQFKRRPPADAEALAGGWSIAEVLAHLLAAEQREGDRLEALLSGNPHAAPALTDEQRTAEARQGRAVPVPQVIHGLLAARRRIERALTAASLPELPDAVSHVIRHGVIEHESEHRAQIEAVKASLGAARVVKR